MFLNVRRMLKFAKRESASARFERHLEQSGIVLAHVQDIAIADELEQPARIADLQEYVHRLYLHPSFVFCKWLTLLCLWHLQLFDRVARR